jgi:flagellar biosynthesis chaperone FliJ
MARDSLQVLLAMRRRSVEKARYALGACLAAELQAAAAIQAIADAARRDRAAYQSADHPDQFLEMYVRRLHVSDEKRLAAEAALRAARARSAEARAAVLAARMAAEAVETLSIERAAAAELEANRREPHALDDMARTRFNSERRPAGRGRRQYPH